MGLRGSEVRILSPRECKAEHKPSLMHYNFEFFLTISVIITGLCLLLKKVISSNSKLSSLCANVGSFFWVLLIVLIIRSFIAEPFRIPSASMLPTLQEGDFILVNKYTYGLRLPVLRNTFLELGQPERGDVVVFKYPLNTKKDFIKRIIGLPGDTLEYRHKQLYINGQAIKQQKLSTIAPYQQYIELQETMPQRQYNIYTSPHVHTPNRRWLVPAGHYFVMGDNRDNSDDSRRWGFVPTSHLLGRAFYIWMHWNWHGDDPFNFSRVGTSIE